MPEPNHPSPAPSRNCPHCGERLEPDSLFCSACGRPVPPPSPAPPTPAAVVTCPACRAPLKVGTKFCTTCGHALAGPSANVPAAPVRKIRPWGCLALVAVLLVLLVAAGAGLIWWAPWKDKPPTDPWKTMPTLPEKDGSRSTSTRSKKFEVSRVVTLLGGQVQGQVAVVLEGEGGSMVPQAEVGPAGQDGLSVNFKVQPQTKGAVRWYAVRVTVSTLAPRGGQGWTVVEGRWLGEVESAQSGDGVYSCRIPCRADNGAACELHLVVSPGGSSALNVAPVLRLTFAP